jgi:ribosomal-protein-alanine N-acetyltransferase
MPELTIGLMKESDIDRVHAIETACFAAPWSRESFRLEVTENACARYLVLREDGHAVAYGGMWFVLDEGHITNIAVRPDRRRLGYGEMVTRAMIRLAADSGMSFLTLECRRSNIAAQAMYRKLGFVDVGYRRRYYADNNEDALIMINESLPEGNPENDPFLVREKHK